MEEEIEDIVGVVNYTDSQKSITCVSSLVYSSEFTDSSSDRNNSLGKETYVIEWDSEDSEKTIPLCNVASNVFNDCLQSPMALNVSVQSATNSVVNNSMSTSLPRCSILQETFTQTSKTILQLAETERMLNPNKHSLETQTSLVSITENKTIEYRIEVSNANNKSKNDIIAELSNQLQMQPAYYNVTCNRISPNSKNDSFAQFPVSETEMETSDHDKSGGSSNDQLNKIIIDKSIEGVVDGNPDEEHSSGLDSASDIEEDSLMGSSIEKETSGHNEDTTDLQKQLINSLDGYCTQTYDEPDLKCLGTLTPLTEESNARNESLVEITPTGDNIKVDDELDDFIFTSNAGMNVKVLKDDKSKEPFKLPPIEKQKSCPNSPHLNSLFNKNNLTKSGTLPSLHEKNGRAHDRWELGTKNLASGENLMINGRSISPRKNTNVTQLPPIHREGPNENGEKFQIYRSLNTTLTSDEADVISIKEKIKELSTNNKRLRSWSQCRSSERRSSPPGIGYRSSVEDRGCEALCVALLKRLQHGSWIETVQALEDLPKDLEKFWGVITEYRIADLIRHTYAHIDSPRPQVVRAACKTLAAILKNTNYTKRPDFYESINLLLVKTGSFSRAVRRAANVALDEVVCNVDLAHAVTALCEPGVDHKNGQVRSAAARLLVVCCALAGGGRDLLRARPTSAVGARRHALRALAALLDDKSLEARKYAERLYSMLRPLPNFEAYYLTDVDAELASRQMKKFDKLLLCGPPKETR